MSIHQLLNMRLGSNIIYNAEVINFKRVPLNRIHPSVLNRARKLCFVNKVYCQVNHDREK